MTCQNCKEPLSGIYCSVCGQKAVDVNRPLRELAREGLESLTAFDSRVIRTFWPLIRRPGFLTLEYLEGRRSRYVPPLKLYLFVSFVLFLTLSVVKVDLVHEGEKVDSTDNRIFFTLEDESRANRADLPETTEPTVEAPTTIEEDTKDPASAENESSELSREEASNDEDASLLGVDLTEALEDEDRLESDFVSRLAQVVFLLVPAFAGLLKLVYWRSGRLYIQHLIFSLHVHCFAFLVLWLRTMLTLGPEILSKLGEVLVLLILLYLLLAMKRVYGQGWPKTLLKFLVLWLSHLFVLLAIFLAAFFLAASMA